MAPRVGRSPLWTTSLHDAIFDEDSGASTVSPHTTLDESVTAVFSTPLSLTSASTGEMNSSWNHASSHRAESASRLRVVPPPLTLVHTQQLQCSTSDAASVVLLSPACSSATSISHRRSLGSEMGLTPRIGSFDNDIDEEVPEECETSLSAELAVHDTRANGEHKILCVSQSNNTQSSHSSHDDGHVLNVERDKKWAHDPVSLTSTHGNIDSMSFVRRSSANLPSTERQVVLIEMNEERVFDRPNLENDCMQINSPLPSVVRSFAPRDAGDQYTNQTNEFFDEADRETSESLTITPVYDPYQPSTAHYLEPVEEVTEEATFAEASDESTHGNITYEQASSCSATSSPTAHQSPNQFSASPRATANMASKTTPVSTRSTSTPRKAIVGSSAATRASMREWEQLHGLGTPSSTFSSPHSCRFGWAEVIASAPPPPPLQPVVPQRGRSLPRWRSDDSLLSKTATTSPASQQQGHGRLRTVRSPARLIGLHSPFWITSPVALTLGHQLLNARTIDRSPLRSVTTPVTPLTRSDCDNIRLSIESSRSPDESGWAHVLAYSRDGEGSEGNATPIDGQGADEERTQSCLLQSLMQDTELKSMQEQKASIKATLRWTQRWSRLTNGHSTLSNMRSAR